MATVLWLQIANLLWQFVRGEKYCRVPYAVVVHTFMWVLGRWGRPFALRNYLVLETGREKFYVTASGAESIQSECVSRTDRYRMEVSHPEDSPALVVISIPAVNYKLCIHEEKKTNSFVWNYLRDKPECLARVSDVLLPNLSVIDRISDLEGLRMMCQGEYIPSHRCERFLAIPDRKHELNPNFVRLLSTAPLMAQAMGEETLSLWISVGVLLVDHLSLFFNWVWQKVKRFVYHIFAALLTESSFQPRTKKVLYAFLSTVSSKLKCSDQVRQNLVKVRKGDLVYTMYPQFNLADFEKITVREFTRKRKTPRPYSEEKFGTFTFVGDEVEMADGTPVISHYIDGARIDTIFQDDGCFWNYRNNEAIHIGMWSSQPEVSRESHDTQAVTEDPKDSQVSNDFEDPIEDSRDSKGSLDSDEDYNNIQDLLQVMEEMQMLPLRQTESGDCESVHFNRFVCPGKSTKDLTFLIAKKTTIIGG